mmetsp:Transcript_36328/g.67592  ORF Transcript_36328/g.67592 Transcript_36328/m.67592 type:complete len:159 (-) Transcript_36328:110-586(-)
MGLTGSHLHVDHLKDMSPWATKIIVKNTMATPALLLEARQHHAPSPDQVFEHWVAPGEHAIMSGWLKEPKATLYVRTGIHSAKKLEVPNFGRICISNDPHGLRVETQDATVVINDLDLKLVERVPGGCTIPMMLRNEHFTDAAGAKHAKAWRLASATA